MKHLPAIDGLRAIAVLAVVAYHAGLPVPAGFVGVDVFFVISGYLITRLLAEEQARSGRIDFVAFYARRARRILPALAVVILATLALASPLLDDPAETASSAAAASAFVANVFFQSHTGGYWSADSTTMPLLHLWSLSVEEQFYLVWPVVLLLARRKPAMALATLACASLALAEWWLLRDANAAFYQMPARAWELAAGGLVGLSTLRISRTLTWLGLVVVLAACLMPTQHFPGVGALPAVFGAALLIAGIQSGHRIAPLTWKPMVGVGLISYSLYLWHWPLLAFASASFITGVPLGLRLELVALAFVLSVASYLWVETPFRRAGSSRKAVALGVACLAIIGCGAMTYAHTAEADRASRNAFALDYPKNHKLCQLYPADPITPKPRCQNRPGTPEVIVWGDSMAQSWQPLAFDQGRVAVAYSRIGCPSLLGFTPFYATKEDQQKCKDYTREILRRAQAADTVVLANAWNDYFGKDPKGTERQLAALLAALPHRVVIIGPTPALPATVAKCLRLGCAVPRARFLRDTQTARTTLMRLAQQYHARYLDPTDFFCPHECGVRRGSVVLYWDYRHVSSTAALAFARTTQARQAMR